MTSTLAVAAVTATLQHLLQAPAQAAVPGAQVRTLRLDQTVIDRTEIGVNVFLYRVQPTPALRNEDLPTRRADGSLIQAPRIALDLLYLLTFLGSDERLEPQRLLGAAVATLHAWPQLPRSEIAAAVAGALSGSLAASDLATQVESVKLTFLQLGMEDMSRLWTTFGPVPYQLSVTYQASLVMLVPDLVPRTVLPVQHVHVDVATQANPDAGVAVATR